MVLESVFVLSVDYSHPVFQGVVAGHYDYANPNVTPENFPNRKGGAKEVLIRLKNFQGKMKTD